MPFSTIKKCNQSAAFPPKLVPVEAPGQTLYQLPGANNDDDDHKGNKNLKK